MSHSIKECKNSMTFLNAKFLFGFSDYFYDVSNMKCSFFLLSCFTKLHVVLSRMTGLCTI